MNRIGARRLIPDIDRFEAVLGDAKRHRCAVVIASPDRERATGADLLQQAGADQLIDNLSGGFASKVLRAEIAKIGSFLSFVGASVSLAVP